MTGLERIKRNVGNDIVVDVYQDLPWLVRVAEAAKWACEVREAIATALNNSDAVYEITRTWKRAWVNLELVLREGE